LAHHVAGTRLAACEDARRLTAHGTLSKALGRSSDAGLLEQEPATAAPLESTRTAPAAKDRTAGSLCPDRFEP
jgi:hypothetical protein